MSESQNLTLTHLSSAVADRTGITKTLALDVAKALFEEIVQAVIDGETVRVTGFGTLSKQATVEREARNPTTGEPITVPAGHRISFKASKPFKDAVKSS